MLKPSNVEVKITGFLKNHLLSLNLIELSPVPCPDCNIDDAWNYGKAVDGRQRVRCRQCKKAYTKLQYPKSVVVDVSYLPPNSMFPVCRICDTCKQEETISWRSYQRAKANRLRTELDNCKSCSNRLAQTKINKPSRERRFNSLEDQTWAKKVKDRDGYKCQACGKLGGSLVSHHISPWAKDINSRFDLNNGITLCNPCHNEYHNSTGGKKTLAKCNKNTIADFLSRKKSLLLQ